MVNKLPLYPTEDILWDESLVPFDDIKKKDGINTKKRRLLKVAVGPAKVELTVSDVFRLPVA